MQKIWWCSVGTNVGAEICGKGKTRNRPVLILKKLSKRLFLGIPFTSKKKRGSWFVNTDLSGKKQTVIIAQIRVMSSYRLHNKMGQLPGVDFARIKRQFHELYK